MKRAVFLYLLLAISSLVYCQTIRLDQINLTNGTNGFGSIKINRSTMSNPIKLNGITYPNGVGVHSPSEIILNLFGKATRFQATVGIDDDVSAKPNEANLEFKVLADQKLIWSSGIMKYTDALRTKNIDLDLTGYYFLTLITTLGSDGVNYSDHADWASAILTYSGSKPICIPKGSDVLSPKINNGNYFFARTGIPMMTRFNITSLYPQTTSITGLPNGLTYNATRKLVSGTISKPGKYAFMLKANNEYGPDSMTITIDVRDTLDAPTPPMGWNTWNVFGGNIDEAKLKSIADALVTTGMKDAGYTYLIIDDLWAAASRDANGMLQADATKFPSGMKALADYMHSKGIKLGIYSDAALNTCGGSLGSYGNEVKDANQFAAWGIDMLKYDYCGAPSNETVAKDRYKTMGDALKNTGQKILFNICEWGQLKPWIWASTAGGHTWRTTWDSRDIWDHGSYDGGHCGVVQGLDRQKGLEYYSGPNRWNDPDMVMAGLYGQGLSSSNAGASGMTDLEYQSQFSLWCLLAAPIQTSFDITKINEATKKILTNQEAIAVDQDVLGQQATMIQKISDVEVYMKDLADGSVAVGLLNRNNSMTQNVTLNWSDLFLSGNCTVRDLWLHSNLDTNDRGITLSVAPHETRLLKITPAINTSSSSKIRSISNFNVYFEGKDLHVDYQLMDQSSRVRIELMNASGSVVSLIEHAFQEKGQYKSRIGCSELASGFYICRIQTMEGLFSKKVILN